MSDYSWSPQIIIHAVSSGLALVLGTYNLLRKTHGDKLHRYIGGLWMGLMVVSAFSSFFITRLMGGFSSTHLLSLLALAGLCLAVFGLIRHRYHLHSLGVYIAYGVLLFEFILVFSAPKRMLPVLLLYDSMSVLAQSLAVLGFGGSTIMILKTMAKR